MRAVQPQYREASREEKTQILNEFRATTGYCRKYAIALLSEPVEQMVAKPQPRKRKLTWSNKPIDVLADIWKAAGYPWSKRLKAMLPLWVPWAREYDGGLTEEMEEELCRSSATRSILRQNSGGHGPSVTRDTHNDVMTKTPRFRANLRLTLDLQISSHFAENP